MIERLQTLLLMALDRIPLLFAITLIVIIGNLIWETGGEEVVHRMLSQRRTGWLFLGWLFLLASLIMIGYILDDRVSWWYAASAAVGSTICIIALALMARSTLRPIDERLAPRTIKYRDQNGNFGTPADLKHVPSKAYPAQQHQDAGRAVGASVAQHAVADKAGMPPAPAQAALEMNQVGAARAQAREQPTSTADEEQEQEVGGKTHQTNSNRHADKKAGDK